LWPPQSRKSWSGGRVAVKDWPLNLIGFSVPVCSRCRYLRAKDE
jgi:hypothetical protein